MEENKVANLENNVINERVKIETLEKSSEKTSSWFEKNQNLILIGIFLFTIALRLYYFWITKSQPLWWDESEYMSGAKAIAGLAHYDLSATRSPLFPAVMSIFFFLHITNEAVMRFLGLFLPSILIVFLTYFMIKEMYNDNRIAFISTLIMSVLWEHLFYSNRFHTENMALIFEFLAIFILFRCYIKNKDFYFIKSKYSLIWIIGLSILSFLFRPGNILFVPAILVFIILLNKKIFSKTGLIGLSIVILAIIASFIFTTIPQAFLKQYMHLTEPIGWKSLTVFYGFYQSVSSLPSILFYAFIIGLLVVLFKVVLMLDQIIKLDRSKENIEFKSNVFNLLLLGALLFVFVFIMRANSFEYRWFFPLLPGMLAFTSMGVLVFSDYIGTLSGKKIVATLLIILIVLMGVYNQANHANQIIKMKVDSYSQVKESGLWIKENSLTSDSIISASVPQHSYYSERKVLDFYVNGSNENESAFDLKVSEYQPKYIVVSAFEPGFTPQWAYTYADRHNSTMIPIKVYTQSTSQGDQPVLVIFQMIYPK